MLIERYMQALNAFNARDLEGWLAVVHEDVEMVALLGDVAAQLAA